MARLCGVCMKLFCAADFASESKGEPQLRNDMGLLQGMGDLTSLTIPSMGLRPLKSHNFAVRLTVSRTISRSHDQLQKCHGKEIHKLMHKLFQDY